MDKIASRSISGYIAEFKGDKQKMLKDLRAIIEKDAPNATKTIRYGIPTFQLHGNLVHFGAYENHIGFYPGPNAIAEFKDELSMYKTSKGTVQFPLDSKLPTALITKIVKFRVKENTQTAKEKQVQSQQEHIEYHRDGSVWAKGKMKEGVPDGAWQWFRKDGTRMRSGSFKNGKQVGVWTTYDKAGQVHKVTKMDE